MVNSTFFGKNSVASAHLKLFSELNWFLELESQPKIEFEKLDLYLTLIKKKKRRRWNSSLVNSSSMLLKKITQMELECWKHKFYYFF